MINNNLMNILTQQQAAFDAKIETNGVNGMPGLMNADMAAEFMGELQKQMSSEEQMNLLNALQMNSKNPQAQMLNPELLGNDQALKDMLVQVKNNPELAQKMPAELIEKLNALTPDVLTKEENALVNELKPMLNKLNKKENELAKLDIPSSEDFLDTMNLKNKTPKMQMTKNIMAKQYAKNEMPNDQIIKFNQNVNVSSQQLIMDPIKGAQLKTTENSNNIFKNNFGEIKTESGKNTKVEGQTIAEVLAMNDAMPYEVNSVVKAESANIDLNNNGVKVLEMSSITEADVSNPDQLINKISDYIIQSKVANEPKVELSMNHEDLGKIDILVEKVANDMINISITPNQVDGKAFFQTHKMDLLNSLSQSGINVAEFKLETNSSSSNNLSQNSSNQSFSNGGNQHQSQQNERDAQSQKRQELWEMFYDREVA